MTFRTEPVRVANGSDEEGTLVFSADDGLVAVLTILGETHEGMAGRWYLEAGFGPLDGPNHPTFETLDGALDWIGQRRESSRPLRIR